jgi:hypothetical protein
VKEVVALLYASLFMLLSLNDHSLAVPNKKKIMGNRCQIGTNRANGVPTFFCLDATRVTYELQGN